MFAGNHRMIMSILDRHCRTALPPRLATLLAKGFESYQGCLFYSAFIDDARTKSWRDFHDRSGFECFINHVHLREYTRKGDILMALGLAKSIIDNFISQIDHGDIQVVIGDSIDGIVVRFHMIRPGESWLAEGDLDGYLTDGVMYIQSAREYAGADRVGE
jgi:hypothetical protein